MKNLTELLELEGHKRGLIASDQTLTAESAFALVRDMPYQRASSRRPESIIEEWRGTCSGKHINEVLQGQNPQAFKEQLIAEFCGASSRTRDDFIEGMSRWLSEATQSQSKTSLTSKTSLRR